MMVSAVRQLATTERTKRRYAKQDAREMLDLVDQVRALWPAPTRAAVVIRVR